MQPVLPSSSSSSTSSSQPQLPEELAKTINELKTGLEKLKPIKEENLQLAFSYTADLKKAEELIQQLEGQQVSNNRDDLISQIEALLKNLENKHEKVQKAIEVAKNVIGLMISDEEKEFYVKETSFVGKNYIALKTNEGAMITTAEDLKNIMEGKDPNFRALSDQEVYILFLSKRLLNLKSKEFPKVIYNKKVHLIVPKDFHLDALLPEKKYSEVPLENKIVGEFQLRSGFSYLLDIVKKFQERGVFFIHLSPKNILYNTTLVENQSPLQLGSLTIAEMAENVAELKKVLESLDTHFAPKMIVAELLSKLEGFTTLTEKHKDLLLKLELSIFAINMLDANQDEDTVETYIYEFINLYTAGWLQSSGNGMEAADAAVKKRGDLSKKIDSKNGLKIAEAIKKAFENFGISADASQISDDIKSNLWEDGISDTFNPGDLLKKVAVEILMACNPYNKTLIDLKHIQGWIEKISINKQKAISELKKAMKELEHSPGSLNITYIGDFANRFREVKNQIDLLENIEDLNLFAIQFNKILSGLEILSKSSQRNKNVMTMANSILSSYNSSLFSTLMEVEGRQYIITKFMNRASVVSMNYLSKLEIILGKGAYGEVITGDPLMVGKSGKSHNRSVQAFKWLQGGKAEQNALYEAKMLAMALEIAPNEAIEMLKLVINYNQVYVLSAPTYISDLFQHTENGGKPTDEFIAKNGKALLGALIKLGKGGMIHSDLRSPNIAIYQEEPQLRIADFGLATRCHLYSKITTWERYANLLIATWTHFPKAFELAMRWKVINAEEATNQNMTQLNQEVLEAGVRKDILQIAYTLLEAYGKPQEYTRENNKKELVNSSIVNIYERLEKPMREFLYNFIDVKKIKEELEPELTPILAAATASGYGDPDVALLNTLLEALNKGTGKAFIDWMENLNGIKQFEIRNMIEKIIYENISKIDFSALEKKWGELVDNLKFYPPNASDARKEIVKILKEMIKECFCLKPHLSANPIAPKVEQFIKKLDEIVNNS